MHRVTLSLYMRHMYRTNLHIIIILLTCSITLCSQDHMDTTLMQLHQTRLIEAPEDSLFRIKVNGQVVSAIVLEGDTVIVADLEGVNISSFRTFDSHEDYMKYLKYRRYAAKVYPYAVEAIRIFEEAQIVTETMKKRKRKKYLKKLSKDLTQKFEQPLKKLSKTQGKIMVEMIERELETSLYDLIKMTRGKFKAFYWNQSSKLYGYRLKEVYTVGQNPILDVVLQDFDISYRPQKG